MKCSSQLQPLPFIVVLVASNWVIQQLLHASNDFLSRVSSIQLKVCLCCLMQSEKNAAACGCNCENTTRNERRDGRERSTAEGSGQIMCECNTAAMCCSASPPGARMRLASCDESPESWSRESQLCKVNSDPAELDTLQVWRLKKLTAGIRLALVDLTYS